MILNYIKIAWKVLLRHPFYTFITLFGISLTLTVLMVLTSFIDHLVGSHYPENRRNRMLYVQKVQLTDSLKQSRNMGPASYEFMKKYVLTLKTPEKIGIATIFGSANAYVNGKRISLNTKLTNAGFWEVTDFTFLEGKPFNEQHIANGDAVAVITDDLKRQYFEDPTQPVVGKSIEVDNVTYRILGVVEGVPVTRPNTSADIYFPYNVGKSNYRNPGMMGNYTAMLLARKPSDFAAIQAEFQSVISRIPRPQESDGFKFFYIDVKAETFLESFLSNVIERNASGYFYTVVGLVMLLFMSLPAINLVNVNVSRIMERASEIGIRKAFGAPTRTLMGQFVIENLFITFIGGAIALLLSTLVIYLINQSGWIARADLTINLSVFLTSLLVCFVFGLMSGVVPALRMSKLSIVEALKS
ncbi:ABC transporter permease [Tellurirhabdus rosea]|uniref:ABC transporter permease n=1 Tax=Tellurirhabdus rosea TaxID=2674997 RepID=UPI002250FF7A|nr:ABC transporter permease [Tellurirhabdus rosea]